MQFFPVLGSGICRTDEEPARAALDNVIVNRYVVE
jgi:hypothetical protein